MRIQLRRYLFLLLLPLLPAACAQYSRVKEKLAPPPAVTEANGPEEVEIEAALKLMDRDPRAALGQFLGAAEHAAAQLRRKPKSTPALESYNYALSQALSAIRSMGGNVWERPVQVAGPHGTYTLTVKADARYPERHPRLYDYIPASNLDIRGTYVKERRLKPGLGASVVGVRREARPDARRKFALERGYYGVTVVARFRGRVCEVEFVDPLAAESVTMDGHTYPVAADFTAALALLLNDTSPRKQEILNLLRPGDPSSSARIVRLQPFDPDKTTVLLVHGLVDSPATWVPMLHALRSDPEIRRRYQFWFFEYPSGYPYPVSAELMRRELDSALKIFPQRKPMILIGHSMGGLICRLMITDPGDRLWRELVGTRPASQSGRKSQLFANACLFESRREAGRVIFIASPHRGSELASGWLGKLGTKLIRVPAILAKASLEVATLGLAPGRMPEGFASNSVDTLSPENAFVKAINKIPLKRGVPVHSIIGDRGRNDRPEGGDGVVPYRSAHLDGAVSEKVIPSGHSAHQHPDAIAEVLRILKAAKN